MSNLGEIEATLEAAQMGGTQVMNHDYAAAGIAADRGTYVGPTESHDRFVAGGIVTHCQFVTDTSVWTVKHMHPDRLRRLRRMLDATRPKYDCDTCRIRCNTPIEPSQLEHLGWSRGKPTISTQDIHNA